MRITILGTAVSSFAPSSFHLLFLPLVSSLSLFLSFFPLFLIVFLFLFSLPSSSTLFYSFPFSLPSPLPLPFLPFPLSSSLSLLISFYLPFPPSVRSILRIIPDCGAECGRPSSASGSVQPMSPASVILR